jgi:cobalamin biosynthesis Co2+ chelatase CbiK
MEIASFADGAGIPLAGGSFGGTTVLVLPAGASDEDFAAWKAIEDKKAIKRRSMFANLAIARADKEPTLPQVIEGLRQKGRSRVLICPASFCESPQTMQAMQSELGDALRGMDAHWLPGLGAALVR